MNDDDLYNRFSYHPPADEERARQHQILRIELYNMSVKINGMLPEGREKSLAMTKLEEVMFWSNAAIARQA